MKVLPFSLPKHTRSCLDEEILDRDRAEELNAIADRELADLELERRLTGQIEDDDQATTE